MEQKKVHKNIFIILTMLVFLFSWCSVAHAEEESVLLKDMHAEDSNECEIWEEELKDSYGNSYSGNIVNMESCWDSYAVYDLDGEYAQFSGKIIIAEDVHTDNVMDIAIYGDGRELYSKAELTRQTEAQDFDIDVTGVGKLEIRSSGSGDGYVSLVKAVFTKAEERTVPPTYDSLGDLTVIDSVDFEQKTCLQKDTFGNLHKGRQYFDNRMSSDTESYALYNLDQKYMSFSGKLIIDEESTTNCNINVQIYLDDQLSFEQNGLGRTTEPVEVNLDVTNVKVMKIRVVGKAGYLCVVDDILKGHDHTPADWEEEEKATCDKEGKKVQRCTECKEICNTQEIKALGHTPGDWEIEKEATCKAEGKRVKYCTVCKKECSEEKIDKLEHELGDWEVDEEATREAAGKRVKYCKVCKEVCEEETLDKLEHEPGKWEVESEPTCEEEGEKVRHCKVCGEICDTEYIPETEHEPGDWEVETEATCWSEGEESVHCKYCGEWLDSREIPPVEHKEEEEWFVQQEPSCTYEGTRVKRCIYCGETVKVEKIPKTKHKFGKWVTVEGSVWNAPIVKIRICSSCFSEETKNVYAWVWVKPVVIILVFLAVLFGVTAFLMSQKGIQLTAANIKEFFRNGIRNIKYRSKDEEFGDDIFGRRERNGKKKEEKDKDDIF